MAKECGRWLVISLIKRQDFLFQRLPFKLYKRDKSLLLIWVILRLDQQTENTHIFFNRFTKILSLLHLGMYNNQTVSHENH